MIEPQEKIDRLNRLPLNQEAKKYLQKAKLDVDPSFLHVFQLMWWGLKEKHIQPLKHNEGLERFLEILSLEEESEEALKWLKLDDKDIKKKWKKRVYNKKSKHKKGTKASSLLYGIR